jgi:hypothetical protein
MTKGSKIYSVAITILFAGMIGFPAVDNFFYITKEKSQADTTAVFPEIRLFYLDPVPRQLETYFDKAYLVKDKLVRMNSIFKLKALDMSPTVMTVIGSDGWMFWGERIMDDHRCKTTFTPAEIDTVKSRLGRRARWLRSKGIKFYFVVAPNKHTVYPEYIFPYPIKVGKQTRLEQLEEALKGDTLVNYVEVLSRIREGKKHHQLYHKTDNHWNAYGAYYAYSRLAEAMQNDFPGLKAFPMESFRPDTVIRKGGGSEAHFINIPELFEDILVRMHPRFPSYARQGEERGYKSPEGFVYPTEFELVTVNDSAALGTAVFIRDSFTDALMPYTREHFKKSVYIFDAWQYRENRYIIEQEKPQAVFLIIWEGNLQNLAFDYPDYKP